MQFQSRRSVLKGFCAAILSAGAFGADAAASGESATVVVDQSSEGIPVAPNFIGLSHETAALTVGSSLTADNHSLVSLVRSLGPQGVIRLGGNTSDRPLRRPSREAIGRLGEFLRATGWSLIYGLNLGSGSPSEAAEEARDVIELAGQSGVMFQLGNEPDLYDSGLRRRGWNVDAYLAEWNRFAAAILELVPRARFAGPDIGSQPGWLAPFASRCGRHLSALTRHYYSDGPAWSPLVSIRRVLDSDAGLAAVMQEAQVAAASAGLPLRMSEVNSVYGGGKPGVSDTLASAVWGADLMFQLAQSGWQGVNFHGGLASVAYSPIVLEANYRCDARPLYRGMLLFAKAAPSRMLPVRCSLSPGLRAYATRSLDGRTRVALFNKDLTRPVRVTIGAATINGAVLRLAGPDPAGTADLMVDGVTAHRGQAPRPLETVAVKAPGSTIDLAPCSAVLAELAGVPTQPDPLLKRAGSQSRENSQGLIVSTNAR